MRIVRPHGIPRPVEISARSLTKNHHGMSDFIGLARNFQKLFPGVSGVCEDSTVFSRETFPNNPLMLETVRNIYCGGEELNERYYQHVGQLQSNLIWVKYGCPVFEVDEKLLSALLLTTPSDAPGLPDLPFPAFMIRLPPRFLIAPKIDGYEEPNWVEYLRVTRFSNCPPDEGTNGNYDLVQIALWFYDLTQTEVFPLVSLCSYEFQSPSSYVANDDNLNWNSDEVNLDLGKTLVNMLIRLVCNLPCWLESLGGLATQKESDMVLRSIAKRSKKPHNRRWVLKTNIDIAPELIEAARQLCAGERTKWHITRRHVVRGHIRHQAYGKGHVERKTIWIKPHFKGPEGGDVLDHVYRLHAERPEQSAKSTSKESS